MNDHKLIGTTQYIQIPSHSDGDIIAKVDTGADTSSIWASSINEKDGELSFVLFAPSSVYYTGEVLKTTDFRVSVVKNSFGVSEYRYKIYLKIKIFNKLYKAQFSLSNRSNNRFPILIGKSFLKNKFIVDVSKQHLDFKNDNNNNEEPIVVLTSRIDKETKDFFELVSKDLTSKIMLLNYKSLIYEIDKNSEPKIQLPDGRDIACAKVVYFKAHYLYQECASAIVKYLQYRHVPFLDKELAENVSRSKFSEIYTLAVNDISVPASKIFINNSNLPEYKDIINDFGKSFVIKDTEADRGNNNFLVTNKKTYLKALSRLADVKTLMIQEFIENDGFMRILIMGGDIVQIVKRTSADHKDPLKAHLNKPAGSHNAIEISEQECGADVIALARKATLAMKRNIVGVDMIQDKNTSKWYVLEVNYNPEMIKGINMPKKASGLAKMLEKER